MVIVSHNPDEIKLCDNVIVMDYEKIQDCGTVRELSVRNDFFKKTIDSSIEQETADRS
jgi:ABC-type multidrug transport system ATPase subunit